MRRLCIAAVLLGAGLQAYAVALLWEADTFGLDMALVALGLVLSIAAVVVLVREPTGISAAAPALATPSELGVFPAAAGLGAVFPALRIYGDILSQISSAIIGFFTSIWNGIQAFFGQIFQSIANVISTIFQAPVNAITASWTAFTNWANGFGPIAPLVTVLMVGLVFGVAAFFVWLIVKLSVSETEQTAEEVEEGV